LTLYYSNSGFLLVIDIFILALNKNKNYVYSWSLFMTPALSICYKQYWRQLGNEYFAFEQNKRKKKCKIFMKNCLPWWGNFTNNFGAKTEQIFAMIIFWWFWMINHKVFSINVTKTATTDATLHYFRSEKMLVWQSQRSATGAFVHKLLHKKKQNLK